MMSNIFELLCLYEKDTLSLTVQKLSDEYPYYYAVFLPKEHALNDKFDNVPVIFMIFFNKRENSTYRKVGYSKDCKTSDLKFEMEVWKELLNHENKFLKTPDI